MEDQLPFMSLDESTSPSRRSSHYCQYSNKNICTDLETLEVFLFLAWDKKIRRYDIQSKGIQHNNKKMRQSV
jgi:hypothetical protein